MLEKNSLKLGLNLDTTIEPVREHLTLLTVSPEQAQTWLQKNNYAKQRQIKEQWVDHLVVEMQNNRFIVGTTIHFAIFNRRDILINGQHSLSAIVKFGKPVILGIHKTHVNTEDEVDLLYSRHDFLLGRSITDAFSAVNLPDKTDLAIYQCKLTSAALNIIKGKFFKTKQFKPSRDELIKEVLEWADEAQIYFSLIGGCSQNIFGKLLRSSTIAVALVTIRYARAKAEQFWREVAQDDGLRRYDPRKIFHDFLLSQDKPPLQTCFIAAHCWNAFVDGKEIKGLPVKYDPEVPINIKLTPFKQEQKGKKK
jgi:hypothetical protein